MRRVVAIILAVSIVTASFCACGKNKDKEKEQETSSTVSTVSAVVTPTPSAAPVQTAKAIKITAEDGLNVRSTPSTDGDILATVEEGAMLPLLVEKASDGWYQVEFEGQSAYVSAEFATPQDVTLAEYNKLRTGNSSGTAGEEGEKDSSAVSASSEAENQTTASASSRNEDSE